MQEIPSLEDIYDLSDVDLEKLIRELESRIKSKECQENIEEWQGILDSVVAELEERKHIAFFTELCQHDNTYLKKMTDFNEEFMKLAGEAIIAHSNGEERELGQLTSIDEKEEIEGEKDEIEGQVETDVSQQSKLSYNNTKDEGGDNETGNKKKEVKKYVDVKMNLGSGANRRKMEKGKPEKSAVVVFESLVLGRAKNKQKDIVDEKGHFIKYETAQACSSKSIKDKSSKLNGENKGVKSEKEVPKIESNQTTFHKPKCTTKVVSEPTQGTPCSSKSIKSTKSVKKSGINNEPKPKQGNKGQDLSRMLVEMVKEEELKKKQRQERMKEMEMKRSLVSELSYDVSNDERKDDKGRKDNQRDNVLTNDNNAEKIKEIDKIQETVKDISIGRELETTIVKKEDIVEEVELEKHGVNEMLQKTVEVIEEEYVELQESEKDTNEEIKEEIAIEETKKAKQEEAGYYEHKNNATTNKPESNEETVLRAELEIEKQSLREIKAEASKPVILGTNFGRIISVCQETVNLEQNDMEINAIPFAYEAEENAMTSNVTKRCYNEDYWVHVREEAELKIARFKQEKELMSQDKTPIPLSERYSEASLPTSEHITDNDVPLESKLESNSSSSDQEVSSKKLLKQQPRKEPTKRLTLPLSHPIHPIPQFNYLEVYPTFSNIFSVMYSKPEGQAQSELPTIMRDVITMFTSHVEHFRDKKSVFQPAIFMPFDQNNSLAISDPKQLLLHAENTYVSLKSLVERLEIFNGNIQGQFTGERERYYRVVKTKEEVYDIITTSFLRRKGWKELPHGCSLRASWNLFWSWSKPDLDLSRLLVWQRINHFPFNKNLSRKDLLYKNLDAFRKTHKVGMNFLPLTFNLPKEFSQFSAKFHEEELINNGANYWIMKPIGKSRGRGIKVISNLCELNYVDNIVVQKYISNPLLLDGYKFDMRIYVLVTSFHPLEAFIYKEGFARLSTEKFSMEASSMKNTFIHLTNFAIQRNNLEGNSLFAGGSKISLKLLKEKITKLGISFGKVWEQVHQIVVKSLLGCSVAVPAFPTAFELFGYDVMIDTEGNCHLIEINASPSLERTFLIDEIVKQSLIDDIMDIVDPPNFDKEELLEVLNERLNADRKKFTAQDDLIAIARILKYQPIRKWGEMPSKMGLFELLAPSKLSQDIEKLIKNKSGANNPHNID